VQSLDGAPEKVLVRTIDEIEEFLAQLSNPVVASTPTVLVGKLVRDVVCNFRLHKAIVSTICATRVQ